MKKTKAFTLVELLVVMAIIGILMAILVPAVSTGMSRSKRLRCLGNVRQIAAAAQIYFDDQLKSYQLPYVGKSWENMGAAAELLLPYVGDDFNVFNCPANTRPVTEAVDGFNPVMPGYPDRITEYEMSGFACSADNVSDNRKRSQIYDYSAMAYSYDYPYEEGQVDDVDPPHKGGINIAYLDGHAAWVPTKYLNLGSKTNAFYHMGHDLQP